MNKARFLFLLVIFIIILILPACQPDTSLPQVATTSIPLTPFATLSVTHPPLPTRHLEFSDLNEAQTAVMFSIWLPNVIPDDLPFYKAGISDYADGSENVSIVYLEPGDPLDANLKMFDIQITRTDEPVSYETITHQFKVNTLDVHEVQVRGRTGFTKRGETWGFANGADEHGEFSLQLTSLQPLEGQTKATWDIRLVHAHGVACAEITMP